MNLPEFPTFSLKEPVDWVVNGFVGFVSDNASLAIGAGVVMAFAVMAVVKIKGFAKKAIR